MCALNKVKGMGLIMEIIIRGDKLEVTKAMKDYIDEKLKKLEKYCLSKKNQIILAFFYYFRDTDHEARGWKWYSSPELIKVPYDLVCSPLTLSSLIIIFDGEKLRFNK